MTERGGRRVAIVLCVLLGAGWVAGAQQLNVDGDVTGTSFTGDGSNLTAVPDDIFHGFTSVSCAAGQTCSVIDDCPAGFEVTGGGFFINTADPAPRKLVTLHQSYRFTPTQWAVEATNGSGVALDFSSVAECTRVPAGAPLTSRSAAAFPPGRDPFQILLLCPESDTARFVDTRDAPGAHFCPNHGLALETSGGGPSTILPAWGAKAEAPAGR